LDAVWLVFLGELRRRWRSWLVLSLLISLVGGLVLAATVAGRRTDTAFPRFVAAYGYDAAVFTIEPAPELGRLPDVVRVTALPSPINGTPTCRSCTFGTYAAINNFSVLSGSPRALSQVVKLVAGRMPDPRSGDQVLASFNLEQNQGVHVGSVVRVPLYARSQLAAAATAVPPPPAGPTVALRVVGIAAGEGEFPAGAAPMYDLYATATFARTVLARSASGIEYVVRLRHGARDLPRFETEAAGLNVLAVQGGDEAAAAVETSIRPQAVGWWILGALTALVGLVIIGQALARQTIVESEDHPTLSTLGMDRCQLIGLGMGRNALVGLAAAAGSVALAAALSPLTPVGEARIADPSSGVVLDPLVLGLGSLATVAVVVILGTWPVLRAARTPRSDDEARPRAPSGLVARVAAVGAPPSAVVGVRHAVERGSSRPKVPVGSALAGTALAVMALCATAVFGASLSHLTASPALYGDEFQLNVSDPGSGGVPDPKLTTRLEHDPTVRAITVGMADPISVNGVPVTAIAMTPVRGPLLLSLVDGRLPDGPGQIALGASTMRQAGAHLGAGVRVSVPRPGGGSRTVPFTVVARVSLPVVGGDGGLGTGAALTGAAYRDAACPAGPGRARCRSAVAANHTSGTLVQVVPGASGRAAVARYVRAYPSIVALPVVPTSLVNFGEAVDFPLIFGVVLALFGAATLVHLLVVSVSRRRREIGLLKALGFVNYQAAAAVGWQATTVAVIGIVVGVPLGIAVGQAAWQLFATNLGVVAVPVVEIWLLAALVAGVLVAANVLAVVPALTAARSRTSDLLQAR